MFTTDLTTGRMTDPTTGVSGYLIDPETGLMHEPEGVWIDLDTFAITEFEVDAETGEWFAPETGTIIDRATGRPRSIADNIECPAAFVEYREQGWMLGALRGEPDAIARLQRMNDGSPWLAADDELLERVLDRLPASAGVAEVVRRMVAQYRAARLAH